MLETLDAVGWDRLTHAYGYAGDVPGQIRGLGSADGAVRDKALHELWGNIFHQGTRYEASAYAVPFLLELVADPATPGRVGVLELLAGLAVGYGEDYLPAGFPIAELRAAAVGGDVLLAAGKEYVDDEDDDEDDEEDDADDEDDDWPDEPNLYDYMQILEDADVNRLGAYVELTAYDAVRAGLPLVRSLLQDADAEVRAAAAYVLAWFPEEAEDSLSALVPAVADASPGVAATALVAIGLVGTLDAPNTPDGVEVAAVLAGALDDPQDVVRWGAAIGLARLKGADAGPKVADELHGWLGGASEAHEEIPFFDGDLRGYAARSVTLLSGAHTAESFDALLGSLPQVSGTEALRVAEAALHMAFPDRPLPADTPFADLDERQQRLVRVLAESPDTWRIGETGSLFGNFAILIGGYGLPRDPDAMAEYAG